MRSRSVTRERYRPVGAVQPAELLVPRLTTPVAPALVSALYRAVVVLAVLSGLSAMLAAFIQAWWLGLVAVLLVPLAVWTAVAAARVGCELACAVLAMAAHVERIDGELPHLRSTVDSVADDMPSLRFLRRGANNRERSAAPVDD